jgi:hypothetical protein
LFSELWDRNLNTANHLGGEGRLKVCVATVFECRVHHHVSWGAERFKISRALVVLGEILDERHMSLGDNFSGADTFNRLRFALFF